VHDLDAGTRPRRLAERDVVHVRADGDDRVGAVERPPGEGPAAPVRVDAGGVLGADDARPARGRRARADDLRAERVQMHHAGALLLEHARQPRDVGGPERAPQVRREALVHRAAIVDAQAGVPQHPDEARIRRHRGDGVLCAGRVRPRREVCEHALRPSDVTGDDDVDDLHKKSSGTLPRPTTWMSSRAAKARSAPRRPRMPRAASSVAAYGLAPAITSTLWSIALRTTGL